MGGIEPSHLPTLGRGACPGLSECTRCHRRRPVEWARGPGGFRQPREAERGVCSSHHASASPAPSSWARERGCHPPTRSPEGTVLGAGSCSCPVVSPTRPSLEVGDSLVGLSPCPGGSDSVSGWVVTDEVRTGHPAAVEGRLVVVVAGGGSRDLVSEAF